MENQDLFMEVFARLKAMVKDTFFLNIGGRIAYALDLLFRRFYNFSLWYVISPFTLYISTGLWLYMHLSYVEVMRKFKILK
jgi:hypothetical protein